MPWRKGAVKPRPRECPAANPGRGTRGRRGVGRRHGRREIPTGGAMKHGKRYRVAAELTRQAGAMQDLAAAVKLVKQTARAKFDETIVVSTHLGVDPRHSDQLVRGTVVLPHGTGKSLRVLVLCKGEKVKEAEAAGADFGGPDGYWRKSTAGVL